MAVESSYVIEFATLGDWLKRLSTNEEQNRNQSHLGRCFPRFEKGARNSDWFLLRLMGAITLVVVFRQSFENRSRCGELLENPHKLPKIKLRTDFLML